LFEGVALSAGTLVGPVYTVRSDSGIAAKGILSGSGSWLGTCYVTSLTSGTPTTVGRETSRFSDQSGSGSWLGTCYVYFTDIWDAYYGLPGDLKIQ